MSTSRFTEILNYLSAISRDVGGMRAEFNDRMTRIETRFDGLDGRFGSLEAQVRDGFEKVGADIRRLARKIDLLHRDSFDLRTAQSDLEERLEASEGDRP